MTWNPLDTPVDFVLLGGQRSPGIAEITGANSPRRLKEFKGFHLEGARVIFRGVDLAHPILTLRLYTADDWDGWHRFSRLVREPPVGKRAKAIDIWHPLLEMNGIRAVMIQDVGQPQQTADGEWTVQIKMTESRPLKRNLETIDGSDNKKKDALDKALADARLANELKRGQRDYLAGDSATP